MSAKLVRDKVPALFHFDVAGKVQGDELLEWLAYKVIEEAEEVHHVLMTNHSKDHLIEELADVLEVIYTICDTSGIKLSEVVDAGKIKNDSRGSFSEGFICEVNRNSAAYTDG